LHAVDAIDLALTCTENNQHAAYFGSGRKMSRFSIAGRCRVALRHGRRVRVRSDRAREQICEPDRLR
jgi:hypothetical protein